MKIAYISIPSEKTEFVAELIVIMREALYRGNFVSLDKAKTTLLELADKEPVYLCESDWRALLAKIRQFSPAFRADFTLDGEILSPIAQAAEELSMLQLAVFFKKAFETKEMVIQIVFDETE